MFLKRFTGLAVVLAIMVVSSGVLGQVTAGWLSATSGLWDDPVNWSSNPAYPNNGQPDSADHYGVVIGAVGNNFTATLNATSITVDSLTVSSPNATLSQSGNTPLTVLNGATISSGVYLLTSGTFSGGPLTIASVMDWHGGAMSGTGTATIATGGVLYCRSAGTTGSTRVLTRPLDNFGVLSIRTGTLQLGATLVNRVGGVINLEVTPGAPGGLVGTGTPLFSNLGRINLTNGSFSGINLVNSGMVHVVGTATLAGATHNHNSVIGGPGVINIVGMHTLSSGVTTFAGHDIRVGFLTIGGNGDLDITGRLSLNATTFSGTGAMTVAPGGTLDIAHATFMRRLDNSGSINLNTGCLTLGTAGTLINRPGGVITIAGGAAIPSPVVPHAITNQGIVNYLLDNVGGIGGNYLPLLTNSGTIISHGRPLYLSSIDHLAGSTIAGAGEILMNSATQTLLGSSTFGGANMKLQAGSVTGRGALILSGNLRWSGGTINTSTLGSGNGQLTVTSSGVLNINATNGSVILSRPLINNGVVNLQSGTLQMGTALLSNGTGGVISISPLASILGSSIFTGNTVPPLFNAGIIRISASDQSPVAISGRDFTNSGTISVDSGYAYFGAGTFNSAVLQAGSTIEGAGTIVLGGGLWVEGDTTLAGRNLSLGAASFTQGTLGGPGSINLTGTLTWTSGQFNAGTPIGNANAGSFNIGPTGVLDIAPVGGSANLARNTNNSGIVTFQSGSLSLFSVFSNRPGGVLKLLSPSNFVGSGTALLTNSGTMNLLDPAVTISVPFTNSGTLNTISGGGLAPRILRPFTNAGRINGRLITDGQQVTLLHGASGGALDLLGSGTASTAGTVTVVAGASASVQRLRQTTLEIQNGATLQIEPDGGADGTSSVRTLNLATSTSRLDLTDNHFIVNYEASGSNPYAFIRNAVISSQIFSSLSDPSRRVGLADNASSLHLSIFGGQLIDESSVLLRSTFAGDANLDGLVNITDLASLATSWQSAGPWTSGDFDYNGMIDIADLGLLATNWQATVPALAATLTSFGLPGASVPEPAIFALSIVFVAFSRRISGLSRG